MFEAISSPNTRTRHLFLLLANIRHINLIIKANCIWKQKMKNRQDVDTTPPASLVKRLTFYHLLWMWSYMYLHTPLIKEFCEQHPILNNMSLRDLNHPKHLTTLYSIQCLSLLKHVHFLCLYLNTGKMFSTCSTIPTRHSRSSQLQWKFSSWNVCKYK